MLVRIRAYSFHSCFSCPSGRTNSFCAASVCCTSSRSEMKILVIGSGGREHALVWKLAQSPHVKQMWCAPGNAGIAQELLTSNQPVECVNISADDLSKLLSFAQEKKTDLVVVGPDNPLALVIVD